MTETIPQNFQDLLEASVPVMLTTVMPDGQPQASPVWCLWEDGHIKISTTHDRQKAKNLREYPQATVLAIDPENQFRYLEVRGQAHISDEDPVAFVNRVAQSYVNQPYYGGVMPEDHPEQERRIVVSIRPTHVNAIQQN